MPTLLTDDISLHYEIDGSGPPLLLIAGMVSDSASWQPIMPLLTDHFTVIRPDNRTTGRTTPWDAPTSMAHYANDCAALLDHLSYPRAHVLGHSMGGLIALHLATTHPSRIQTITLAASAPVRMARNTALFSALVDIRQSAAAPDLWLRAFFPWLFAPAVFDDPTAIDAAAEAALAYPYAQSAKAMRHQLNALKNYDPAAINISQPVQALLAENDLLIPMAMAQPALAGLSGLTTHIIPNAGHSIHWDAPHQVANHVLAFAKEHPI
ncbi:MAG: pimeloyl-ACP methyl ester carboxylesterase [Granulosicoccus sp.]|jgi:pimeloyl-ACP methyl ester carboxylesterase